MCLGPSRTIYCVGCTDFPFSPADALRHSLGRPTMCLEALPSGAREVPPGTHTNGYKKFYDCCEND